MASFSAALRSHRTRAGLTQRQLADSAGVSVRTVRMIESGQGQRPRTATLRQLAQVIGMEPERPETGLRIEVLGPMVVRDGERQLSAGPAKQRSLLALLALHANQVVSQTEIAEVLWGEEPPPTFRELLYASVSRLRKLLRHGSARIEVTSGSGYVLRAGPEELDAVRFTELTGAQALDCWRGSVLSDLPDEVRRHPAALALAQRRLAVALAYADTSIEEGRPALAVPALRALLADEPLHEGLHARLMLALAGCGQQGAALELHTELRERLSDELGVEPGTELRDAHLRVLRGQLTAAPEPVPVSVPRQLPVTPARFTGRELELAALDSSRGTGSTVVISAIGGAGGIGKTWLALTWAHRNTSRFPDGQLYVNLRGYDPVSEPLPAGVALRGFLHALGVDPQGVPADLDEQAALYRSLTADRTMLVVLDNARDSAQVTPLLPGGRAGSVLITSRSTLPGLIATQGAQAISLHTLSDEQARDLLAHRLGAARTAAEPGAVDEILRWCGGLPLALGIVAARAACVSLTDLAGELSTAGSRLTALGTGDSLADLRTVFDTSHTALSPAAALLFRQLGIAPGPDIGLAAATAIAGERTPVLLAELIAAHLVDEYVPGRYRMHDLVRLYAAEKCAVAEREDALRLVVDHYVHSAVACVVMLCPHRPVIEPEPAVSVPYEPEDLAAAMAWADAEHPALLEVIELRLPGVTWQLASALDVYHWRRGQVRELMAVWKVCREVAEQAGVRAIVARAETSIGDSWATLGDFAAARAHLERAIALAEEIGDLEEEARARNSLAWAWDGQGEHRIALRHARKALWLYRVLDRPQLQADMLNCIGWCLIRLGRHGQGRARCEEALALCRRHDHIDGTAHASRSLGELALDVGDHAEAVRRLRDARDLFRRLHHPFGEAGVLSRLGDAFRALGDDVAAARAWHEALALYESQHRTAAASRMRAKLAWTPAPPAAARR